MREKPKNLSSYRWLKSDMETPLEVSNLHFYTCMVLQKNSLYIEKTRKKNSIAGNENKKK